MKNKNYFIVLEGIDGSGTSTQAELLGKYLRNKGLKVVLTQEPTSLETGKLIRSFLKKKTVIAFDKLAERNLFGLLFAADRLYHVNKLIVPKLKAGYTVISDRYALSSMAYQSVKENEKWIEEINSHSVNPDLTVLIDVDVKTGLERIYRRKRYVEIFETRRKLTQIRKKYLELYGKYRARKMKIRIVEGSAGIQEVAEKIRRIIDKLFKL